MKEGWTKFGWEKGVCVRAERMKFGRVNGINGIF